VQLHRKYAGDGLVVVSLDIEPDDWGQKADVLTFLTEKKADFPNYVFVDRPQKVDDWMERHGVSGTPAVVLFDRDGKRVKVPDFKDADEEEAFVKKLLGK
jgi:thioredoxin-related protein